MDLDIDEFFLWDLQYEAPSLGTHTTTGAIDSLNSLDTILDASLNNLEAMESTSTGLTDHALNLSLDAFFSSNGGWRPAVPCNHCRTRRLQCIMLHTTTANPNPVMSCSSCSALFRSCSLAEKPKRQPSAFESPDPVIGQLHGVTEDDLLDFDDQERRSPIARLDTHSLAGPTGLSQKHSASRHVSRTKPLRTWLVAHSDDPYPTVEEKDQLSRATGLTAVQIANWFANARRRQRQTVRAARRQSHFASGSPMPSPHDYSLSPMQRWRNSPPEQESISVAVIEQAIGEPGRPAHWTTPGVHHSDGNSSASSLADLDLYESGSMRSGTSSTSWLSSVSAYSDHSVASLSMSFAGEQRHIEERPHPRKRRGAILHTCKTCFKHFTKRSDLTRHESTIHYSKDVRTWVCSIPVPPDQSLVVWSMDSGMPQCILCGHEGPDDAHFASHEFEACAERELNDRRFYRKDHIWQHLLKFHGCKKWSGWKPDLDSLLC